MRCGQSKHRDLPFVEPSNRAGGRSDNQAARLEDLALGHQRACPDDALRAKVNLSLDETIIGEARALGINMSRVAESAIAEAARLERNRRWREENRAALDAYALEVERDGLPLERFRTF